MSHAYIRNEARRREASRLRASGLSLREVGERLGVSRERVRQLTSTGEVRGGPITRLRLEKMREEVLRDIELLRGDLAEREKDLMALERFFKVFPEMILDGTPPEPPVLPETTDRTPIDKK